MSDKRLDRMLPHLTARERGILTLRDYKGGKPQDRTLLHSGTGQQTGEINRYIGMMNAANGDLGHVVTLILERAKQEQLRLAWLEWARLCALEMWVVRAKLIFSGHEPITESAYREREAEARAELIPIEECAEFYTEYHHVFADADCETRADGAREPTDAAWCRVRDAKLAEMQKAVAAGALKATGKGKRTKIECGSWHDWMGESVSVSPDFGIAYAVLPDDRADEVARERRAQEDIHALLDRAACDLELPLDMESPLHLPREPGGFGVEMARLVAVQLRAGVRENWRELRAIEEKVDASTEEFDGEDVLHPSVRGRLDEAKALLVQLHGDVQEYTGAFDLPEPDDELRGMVERIVEREMRNVPTH